VNPNGPLIVDFVADSGDQVRLTAHNSLLGWPESVRVNWLGGSVPRWKKYVYYRLVWRSRRAHGWRCAGDTSAITTRGRVGRNR
jgi:hypothetical protein